jgi:hypothetical protein
VSDGRLSVTVRCPAGHRQRCQAALQLQVPSGVPVTATTGRGNITAAQLTGRITIRTGQGNLSLHDVSGTVTGRTALGLATGTGLSGADVSLSTDLGSVRLSFDAVPGLVTASSQLSSVAIRVPAGASYDVIAQADLGAASVLVPQSAASGHVIKATSQLGSVTVTG